MSDQILRRGGSTPPRGTSTSEEAGQPEPDVLVAAAMREMAEPRDGISVTPVWLILLFFVLAGWAGYYISDSGGGFRKEGYSEHVAGAAAIVNAAPPDPMVLGRRTFGYCTQCHQDTGKGVPGTYPPLAGSPIVLGDPAVPIRILLNGLQGEVHVAGLAYNGEMPSWKKFSDEQLAAVLTYVRSSWNNSSPAVDPAQVKAIRAETAAREQSWSWPELEALAKHPPQPRTP
jgi:mono/diheme cytochrome c family protein